MQKILIVEDEEKLASLLQDYFKQSGFDVQCIGDGAEVIDAVKRSTPDALLLDLMLPNKDGMEICKELRQFSSVPILITTAKVDELDRLLGLELGADDYICKPYSPREVVARVKAVLRRVSGTAPPQEVFTLDESRLKVALQGKELSLTPVEFALLKKLSERPGVIYNRDQLMDCMYQDHRVVNDRTIDSHIKKLRKKLSESFPGVECIHSVYGAGYQFELRT